MKYLTIASGSNFCVYEGTRLSFAAIVFVKESVISGSYSENRWYFRNYDVELYVDGVPVNGSLMKLEYSASNWRECDTRLDREMASGRRNTN